MPIDFVSAPVTAAVLNWSDLIAAMRDAYAVQHSDRTSFRAVARDGGIWLRGLVAVPPVGPFMGVKSFGRASGRKVSYLVSLFCKETGALVALVDGKHLTSMRTAAASAVAMDRLLPADPIRVGILGSGQEARAHARAAAAVRPISQMAVYSPNSAKRQALADDLTEELGVPVAAVNTPEAAVRDRSLVIAAARSWDETPILSGHWLTPGAVLVSIGSTIPEQRELDVASVERSSLIVCDMVDEVLRETGDFIAASEAGIDCEARVASLNQLVMGQLDDRLKRGGNVMYKSVGAALQDVTAAALAHRLAKEQDKLVRFPVDLEIQDV